MHRDAFAEQIVAALRRRREIGESLRRRLDIQVESERNEQRGQRIQRDMLARRADAIDDAPPENIGGDFKGWLSFTCYVLAIPAAFWNPWVATAIFGMVAVIWFIPDRRIERVVE